MKNHIKMITAMVIFGTIGIFRRMVPISAQILVLYRSILGTVFIFLVNIFRQKPFFSYEIKKNLLKLFISGIALALNWIFLFKAYECTTVAAATVCYYFAPMIVVLFSPILLRIRLTLPKLICVFVSFIGILLISGLFSEASDSGYKGDFLALAAAFLYATVIFINKTISVTDPYLRTGWQFLSASITMIIYVIISDIQIPVSLSVSQLGIVIIIGVFHTGVAYVLYFQSMKTLDIQSTALLSYLDPAVSVLCSFLILHEDITPLMVIGTVLVLASSVFCEITKIPDIRKELRD